MDAAAALAPAEAPPPPLQPQHLPLLELPPGLITELIVPRLRPHQRAALSLTCKKLQKAVAYAVRALVLPGGSCCPAVRHNLHLQFPGVRALTLTPSNLHEALNVLPSLLMTVRARPAAACSPFGFDVVRSEERWALSEPACMQRLAQHAPDPTRQTRAATHPTKRPPRTRHHPPTAGRAGPPKPVARRAARQAAGRAERAAQVPQLLRVAQHMWVESTCAHAMRSLFRLCAAGRFSSGHAAYRVHAIAPRSPFVPTPSYYPK